MYIRLYIDRNNSEVRDKKRIAQLIKLKYPKAHIVADG
jgi:hypothetical protein